jgi:FAD/FMN-containing dehydrogenase
LVKSGSPLTRNHVTPAFTLEAGVQWFEAYAAGKQHNRLIVGGFSSRGSVGAAGGWISGGGHSALAPNYGLGMQNIP